GYMRSFWLSEVIAYLCMLGINGIRLITPQISRVIIDVGIAEKRVDVLLRSIGLLLLTILVQGAFRFGEGFLTERVSQGIAYDMRNELYRKLQSLSFRYHDQTQAGQLLSRATSDVEHVRRVTGRLFLMLVDSLVLMVGTTVVLFRMQPKLAALAMCTLPFIVITVNRFIGQIHPLWHARQDEMGELTSRLEQNLEGVSVVRGFAQEPAEIKRFDNQNDTIYDISMIMARIHSFSRPFMVFLASIGTVIILWVGGSMVVRGTLTLGALVAFNSYVLQLVGPMRRMGFIANMLGESRASAERVFEILDAQSEVMEAPDAQELEAVEGAITFENISFSYGDDIEVLSDISFHVAPGESVALLGPTGSGKSTIINLIPRFYDVTAGAIKVDGTDIRTVTLESLRSQIGTVLQETMLFGSTIRENIAFGRPDATQEQIEEVAKAAAAHDFIESFPDGYDTAVGERGITLSGGQRQRIAIARALLLDPRILILDDATSSVDTETEQQIQEALENLMENRTSIIIAQRVSTVRNADQILVIDDGRLVAQGKHNDLIRQSGVYADIYYRQLRPEDQRLQPTPIGGQS
ncbi:MAG: ABC transporter ATP-binding protein, partial [Chloroflexota bacterium]|nr:ABC transporter ATP-binding protein [Chloroflexota bacterium]